MIASWRRWAVPVVLSALSAFVAWQIEWPLVRRRILLAILVAALLLLLRSAIDRLTGPAGRAARLAVALSFGIVFLLAVIMRGNPEIAILPVALQLSGWIVLLLAYAGLKDVERGRIASDATLARTAAVISVASLAGIAGAHWLLNGPITLMVDETIYLLQSNWLTSPGFARTIDPTIAPFFTIRQALIDNGRMFGQYPPGWPAILRLFDSVGLQWWTGSILGALGVYLTYRLGSILRSPAAGVVAAALMAINTWVVVFLGSYQSHAGDPLLALIAALLVIKAARVKTGWEWAAAFGAGCAAGLLFSSRPVHGIAAGIGIWLWSIVRAERRDWPSAARLALGMALGAVPFLGAVLAYNAVTTGHALTFGYTAVNGAIHDLGFGVRGIMDYGPDGPVPAGRLFTPTSAAILLLARVADLTTLSIAAGFLVPLLLLGRIYRFRIRAAELACLFGVLAALNFFVFTSHARFYIMVLPFLFIEIGALLEHVHRRAAPVARRLALGIVAGGVAASISESLQRQADGAYQQVAYRAIMRLQERYEKVLVFVDAPPRNAKLYQSLYVLNIREFPGPVIVARHRGDHDQELMRYFPDYRPFLIRQIGQFDASAPEEMRRPVAQAP